MLEDDGQCFVCGKSNPCGLQIEFRSTENGVEALFCCEKRFQGYKDTVHGGIIAALLDEASAKALLSLGLKAVTAELTLRYKKPLSVSSQALVRAEIGNRRRNVYEVSAEILGESGELIASSKAKLVCRGDG